MAVFYRPQFRLAGASSFTAAPTTSLTTTTISGLQQNTAYDFMVIADDGTLQSNSNIVANVFTLSSAAEATEGTVVTAVAVPMNVSKTKYVAQSTGPWNVFDLINTGTGRDPQIRADQGSGPTVLPNSGLVQKLVYHNHVIWQQNQPLDWYWWDTASASTDKFTLWTITSVNLSGSTSFTNNLAPGSTIGTISVVQSDAQTFQGSFSVTSVPAGAFSMTGATLKNTVTLTAASYVVSVVATPNTVGNAVTQAFTLTNSSTASIQVPIGLTLATSWGSNSGDHWGSNLAHWNGVKASSILGRTPTMTMAVGGNNGQDPSALPAIADFNNNSWPAGVVGSDGTKYSINPIMHLPWSNGTVDNAFAAWASGTYDSAMQSAIQTYFNYGWRKIYFRPNWEWNNNFVGMGLANAGDLTNFIACWKHWANVCHTKANAIGMTVKTVWAPSLGNFASPESFGLKVSQFFPFADGSAVNGRYVDVMGPDVYALPNPTTAGQKFGFVDPVAGGYLNGTIWCFDTCAKIAQQVGIPVAISEFGDFTGYPSTAPSGAAIAYQSWIPNDFVPYMNNLASLGVPIEYINFYDIDADSNSQWSSAGLSGANPDAGDKNAWMQCLGLTAGAIPKIMTSAVTP